MTREEHIAEVLRNHMPSIDNEVGPLPYWCGDEKSSCWDKTTQPSWVEHVAQVLAAELWPVISTVEELDALPVGAVIRDSELNVLEHLANWYEDDSTALAWATVGISVAVLPDLPVRLIWHPTGAENERPRNQARRDAVRGAVAGYAVVKLPEPDGPLGLFDGAPSGLQWCRAGDFGGVATVAVHSSGDISAALGGVTTPVSARWAADGSTRIPADQH